jgi:N-acetylneuraminate synthase
MITNNPFEVVAEIGCNHMGDIELAKKLIFQAKQSGATAVKFQKRNIFRLYGKDAFLQKHPDPKNSFGENYGEHRKLLEFNISQHSILKNVSNTLGLKYGCSVWDIEAFFEVLAIYPDYIKIPSACNLNRSLLEEIVKNYKGEIHISFGMTSSSQVEEILDFFLTSNRFADIVPYVCTSSYPTCYEDIKFLDIVKFKNNFGDKVRSIGFSGHHLGVNADLIAFFLGARTFERHFTMSKDLKGTDQKSSLNPEDFLELTKNIKYASMGLLEKQMTGILACEQDSYNKLKTGNIVWP